MKAMSDKIKKNLKINTFFIFLVLLFIDIINNNEINVIK